MEDGRLPISDEEKERLVSILKKTMELGIGAVYGEESCGHSRIVDCGSRIKWCRSVCCTFHFALTKDEVKEGLIEHDTDRPFFIKRERDGYCPHLDRSMLLCTIWHERPEGCRNYDCTGDPDIRPENPENIDALIKDAIMRKP